MTTKSWKDLQSMHRACTIVVETLEVLAQAAVAGTSTKDLDTISRERMLRVFQIRCRVGSSASAAASSP